MPAQIDLIKEDPMGRILVRPRKAAQALALATALATTMVVQAAPASAAGGPDLAAVRSLPLPVATVYQPEYIGPNWLSFLTSGSPDISADGNVIGYTVNGPGGRCDVASYVVNRKTGETKTVGTPGPTTTITDLSENGSQAVYIKGCNGSDGVYVQDLATDVVTRVDVSSTGQLPGGYQSIRGVEFDGVRTVVFGSFATGLAPGAPLNMENLYLHDLVTGETQWLRDPQAPINSFVYSAAGVSPGGRYIAFLWRDPTNVTVTLSVFDQVTGRYSRVISTPNASAIWTSPSISNSGKLVFATKERLLPQDTDNLPDVYLRDLVSGTTTLVSADENGAAAGTGAAPEITADGRYVVYTSPGPEFKLMFRNVITGSQRVLTGLDGTPLQYPTTDPVEVPFVKFGLSRTGRYLTVQANAENGFPAIVLRDQAQDCAGDFATSTGSGTIYGSPGDDVIYGSPGPDTIYGGYGGSDVICGMGGDDTIDGGLGDDAIYGGEGTDRVEGNEGNDVVDAGSGADSVNGGTGTDALLYRSATAGVDVSLSRVTPNGMPGEGDQVFNDFEAIFGSAYNDTLSGRETAEWLFGLGGDDTLLGMDGNDELYGGDGKDVLVGMAGDDYLNGGPGSSNSCAGGPGINTFNDCKYISG
ncbi:hypothetical protein Psi02_61150 [Planotetraspora silvatica]|uniref:Calcium-binding protein n=2 Tax=Planotetraspora silvatica TaxID=234614 RepID=A0A8J3USA4_9ACTN|nr:calcium-binding protein [Planotetraspora silvatica]GII49691.1 hypothetical protein Psi02_61150 [Planotetraspora silvatica]